MNRQDIIRAISRTSLIRLWGKISAVLFIMAVLFVLDGLQALARHDFNRFDLIPGETTYISGMLPEGVTSHEDLEIRMEGSTGVTVRPFQSFKGFWLGGQMWRAEIAVPASAAPGVGSLTVIDLVRATRKLTPDAAAETLTAGSSQGANGAVHTESSPDPASEELPLVQNPTLVYSVVIWADAAARQSAEKSFTRRLIGVSSFWPAGVTAVLAILAGIQGWVTFSKVEKSLAGEGLYIVHGVKKPGAVSPSGYTVDHWQALCAYYDDASLELGDTVSLYDSAAVYQGQGVVREMKSESFMAEFPVEGTVPVYGWIISRHMPQT